MAQKRIGILTGGGDVPGLNSVIKTVVYRGSEIDCEVIGIRRGWEGLTHVNLEDPASRSALHPAAQPREHAHHRPHGRHLPAQLAHQPRQDEEAAAGAGGPEVPECRVHQEGRHLDGLRHDLPGAEEHGDAGARLPDRHRRRRHAQLRGAARQGRREGHRHPEDDGQRRAEHRVLHRLLHRHHARHRGHRAAAHHGRLARAHRHLPRLRPRRRLHGALHRLRHLHPLLHSRVQGST